MPGEQEISLWKLTLDRRQRRDSMWFLATESPTNASFFPRTNSRNVLGSNFGRTHWSGFHLQFRKSMSALPWWKQFFDSGIVVQLEFVYRDPSRSGIQWPLNKSHCKIRSSSWPPKTININWIQNQTTIFFQKGGELWMNYLEMLFWEEEVWSKQAFDQGHVWTYPVKGLENRGRRVWIWQLQQEKTRKMEGECPCWGISGLFCYIDGRMRKKTKTSRFFLNSPCNSRIKKGERTDKEGVFEDFENWLSEKDLWIIISFLSFQNNDEEERCY